MRSNLPLKVAKSNVNMSILFSILNLTQLSQKAKKPYLFR